MLSLIYSPILHSHLHPIHGLLQSDCDYHTGGLELGFDRWPGPRGLYRRPLARPFEQLDCLPSFHWPQLTRRVAISIFGWDLLYLPRVQRHWLWSVLQSGSSHARRHNGTREYSWHFAYCLDYLVLRILLRMLHIYLLLTHFTDQNLRAHLLLRESTRLPGITMIVFRCSGLLLIMLVVCRLWVFYLLSIFVSVYRDASWLAYSSKILLSCDLHSYSPHVLNRPPIVTKVYNNLLMKWLRWSLHCMRTVQWLGGITPVNGAKISHLQCVYPQASILRVPETWPQYRNSA